MDQPMNFEQTPAYDPLQLLVTATFLVNYFGEAEPASKRRKLDLSYGHEDEYLMTHDEDEVDVGPCEDPPSVTSLSLIRV